MLCQIVLIFCQHGVGRVFLPPCPSSMPEARLESDTCLNPLCSSSISRFVEIGVDVRARIMTI